MTDAVLSAVEESIDTGEVVSYTEHLDRQTALIEFLSVAAAVLIAVAFVFIIIQVKRKNRGQR